MESAKERSEALRGLKLSEVNALFSAFYPSSWMIGVDGTQAKVLRKAWLMSLNGIFDEQIDYAMNQIATASTPYQKFPPNPQEFRALCMCFKMPEPEKPLQIAHVLSPEEIAEKNARAAEFSRDFRQMFKIRAIEQNEEKRIREREIKKKEDDHHAYLMRLENELKGRAKSRELVSDPKISENIPHQNRGENNGSTNTSAP